jgi:integrase
MGGIKQHGQGIQVTFYWNGKRYRPTIGIPYTKNNIRYAEQLKGEVERAIALGTYTLEQYAKHFPTSKLTKSVQVKKATPTFRVQSNLWIDTLKGKAQGTIVNYTKMINFWCEHLGDTQIDDIKYSEILKISNAYGWKEKYRNDMLIPVRQVFKLAIQDREINYNPCDGIDNGKVQKEPPDPFTIAEVNTILRHIANNYNAQVLNYFEFMFFSGVRPQEAIALKWTEIDFNNGMARIRRVRTASTDRETTKTNLIRDIELNSRALKAITSQKQFTFLSSEYVFNNPVTNKQWNSEAAQAKRYWRPTIKKLGIRYRVPYQMRHTYATLNLMAGANPMWVSKMMGHANMQMLLTTYSKWIDGADKQKEKQKIEAIFDDENNKPLILRV